jgi:serine/threonine-protein phosphatase 2A activator
MLDDISAVKTWDKVNSGMRKMYDAEVLGKLPVMQHALFGSLLPFPKPEDDPELAKAMLEEVQVDSHGHVHEKGWTMDCCGIPGESCLLVMSASAQPICSVPSAFAQAQQTPFVPRTGLKPIPFD